MNGSGKAIVGALIALAIGSPSFAKAETPMLFEEMLDAVDAAVIGTVGPRLDTGAERCRGPVCFSKYQFRVEHVVAGETAYETIELLTLGEPASDIAKNSSCSNSDEEGIQVQPGERILAFLLRAGGSQYSFLPTSNGKVPVVEAPDATSWIDVYTWRQDVLPEEAVRPAVIVGQRPRPINVQLPVTSLGTFIDSIAGTPSQSPHRSRTARRLAGKLFRAGSCKAGPLPPPFEVVAAAADALIQRLGADFFACSFSLNEAWSIEEPETHRCEDPSMKATRYQLAYRYHFPRHETHQPEHLDYLLQVDENGEILKGLDEVPWCVATPQTCEFVDANEAGKIADAIVMSKIGEGFFREHVRKAGVRYTPSRIHSWAPLYHARYQLIPPIETPKPIELSLTLAADGTLLRGSEAIPGCVEDPARCTFIDQSQAQQIAVSHGLEPGTRRWRYSLYYNPRRDAYVWRVSNTLDEHACQGESLAINAHYGEVYGGRSAWWVSHCGGKRPSPRKTRAEPRAPLTSPTPGETGDVKLNVSRTTSAGQQRPVVGARVTFVRDEYGRSVFIETAYTVDDGSVVFTDVPVGDDYRVHVSPTDCIPTDRFELVVKGGTLNEIPVELGSLGSIRVNVSRREDDGTTWSLCGAHVSYRSYAHPQRTSGWITKKDGIATIDCVDTESLGELRVSSPGNRTVVSRDVVVGPDETIEVGVILEPSHAEPNSPE